MKSPNFLALAALLLLSVKSVLPAAEDPPVELTSLSNEDQEIVKALKFGKVDPAPMDTRTWSYIKCRVQVTNRSAQEKIEDKLKIETRLLFKDLKKEWFVLKCNGSFDITKKGPSSVEASFREQNDLIKTITGDAETRAADGHTVIKYAGVVVYEDVHDANSKLPPEWWKLTGSLGSADPQPAGPAGSGIEELDSLRRLVERRLRVDAWDPFEKSNSDLRSKYALAVARAAQSAQAAAKLDDALALKREEQAVLKGEEIPKADPLSSPALTSLRSTYHEMRTKMEAQRDRAAAPIIQMYQTEIDLLVAKLTKAGKLEAAKTVRDARSQPITPATK